MEIQETGIDLQTALQAFDFGGTVTSALRYGAGHINDTFAVCVQQDDDTEQRYILQRINQTVFRDVEGLMQNILGVTEHLRAKIAAGGGDAKRETLTVLCTKQGKPYYLSPEGQAWRCYLFIENAICYQAADTLDIFKESARAFGNFTCLLEDYPAKTLTETIPYFHDTRKRFANLQKAVEENAAGRLEACRAEVEFALARKADCATLMDLLDAGELPLRVTHNDTKLNNVMIDEATGKGLCVIDLDTVMPGLSLHDYGDSIRFGASTGAEDEPDLSKVHFSIQLFTTYTEGYLETAGAAMTPLEKKLMPWGARLMTLECGMRFLTDFLQGDTYFRTSRENHNLERCRTQFQLVREMEESWQEMNEIVANIANG